VVPHNYADDRSVNHALEFDTKIIEHPIEIPDNIPEHGLVNHREEFDANAIKHPAEVPINNEAYHEE
jgi:hypothetical protein